MLEIIMTGLDILNVRILFFQFQAIMIFIPVIYPRRRAATQSTPYQLFKPHFLVRASSKLSVLALMWCVVPKTAQYVSRFNLLAMIEYLSKHILYHV